MRNFLMICLLAAFTGLTPHIAFADDIMGAVSGGGGGTLPAEPIDEQLAVSAILNSRNVIDAYLNAVTGWLVLFGKEDPISRYHDFDKMFAPNTDVFALLGKVHIDLPHGPCYFDGRRSWRKPGPGFKMHAQVFTFIHLPCWAL